MKTVIIFNHPYRKSYCNAILQSVIKGASGAGHEVDLIHLDDDNFDPVMREKDLEAFAQAKNNKLDALRKVDPLVLQYKNRLEDAQYIVFIFPIWWELMPALTKGFIDKVIFPGVAYDYTKNERGMQPLFNNVRGIRVITTMNTPGLLYRIVFGNAIKKAVLIGTFWKMGYKNRKWINLNMVKFVSQQKREKWLLKVEKHFAYLK